MASGLYFDEVGRRFRSRKEPLLAHWQRHLRAVVIATCKSAMSETGDDMRFSLAGFIACIAAGTFVIGTSANTASASPNVQVSGPSEFKNWLYQEGRIGAVVKVRIKDPTRKFRTVQWCLNRGGSNTNCTTRTLRQTGWKVSGGWAGSITFFGARMPTRGCYYMDLERPKVDFVIRVFDSRGRQVARGHHLMTDTCNA